MQERSPSSGSQLSSPAQREECACSRCRDGTSHRMLSTCLGSLVQSPESHTWRCISFTQCEISIKTSSQHNPGLPQPPPDGSFAYWHFRGFLMSIRSRQWMMVSIREVVSGELLGFFQSNARLVQCNLCWNCPSWKDVLNCSVVGGK